MRFATSLVSILGREITGNSEGVGTEVLIGKEGGCEGSGSGQRLEGEGG